MRRRAKGAILRFGAVSFLLALAACSGDTNLVRDAAVATGIGTEPKPAPDFVASTRPTELNYNPVGLPTAPFVAKTPAQVKAAEAAMDQARTANESQAAEARQLASSPAPAAPRSP
jgi:hypothetical protein